jgi:hypothetical protein
VFHVAEIEAMHLNRGQQQRQNNHQSVNSTVHEHVGANSNRSTSMTDIEEKMRRKLRFFFMNPIEKWQAKRRFPYKFVTQLIKIVLVTAQVLLFVEVKKKNLCFKYSRLFKLAL